MQHPASKRGVTEDLVSMDAATASGRNRARPYRHGAQGIKINSKHSSIKYLLTSNATGWEINFNEQ